jgi:cobalt-zinc-cadmium efflux system membrane fusion protein
VLVKVGERSEQFVELIPNNEVNSLSKILVKGVFDLVN